MASIHTFKVEGIDGSEIDFADFKGKKILAVNVASQCGLTPQYQQLQELFNVFNDKLVIIGFPANNFGGQEPGANSEIKEFCTINYGVTFPMTAKISVVGENIHPIYQWLQRKSLNGVLDSEVEWNFHKYLLDENGHLIASFPASMSPMEDDILNLIQ